MNKVIDAQTRYSGEAGNEYFSMQQRADVYFGRFASEFWSQFIKNDDEVLEFGTGPGHTLAGIKAKAKVGVDINPLNVASGRALGLDMVSSLEDVGTRSFSKIISSHALEHVTNPVDSLKQLRSFLRPDGRLLLLLPIDDWRSRYQQTYDLNDIHMHLFGWTPRSLANLLYSSGYSPIDVKVLNFAFPPVQLHAVAARLPKSLFDAVCYGSAFLLKRRQLFASAVPR